MGMTYNIVTNSKGRKILVINELIDVENEEGITYENFDAIYLNIPFRTRSELRLALQRISPFQSNKCWIKPRFCRVMDKNILPGMIYLTDGMADTPFENSVSERIEDIFEKIKGYNVHRRVEDVPSRVFLSLRLCCYCIVRGFMEYTNTVVASLTMGFSTLYSTLYNSLEGDKRSTLFEFFEKLEDQHLSVYKRHIERIHLCPECHSNHLLFIESCPKCNSSDIKQESVIHHFRCANVSPESTYNYDGQLRCPKCRQLVRHIGVDYDRPADIYSCTACGHTFLNSSMRVFCSDCSKTWKPSQLLPHNIELFRFTDEGISSIVSSDAIMSLQREVWNGYTHFDVFIKLLRWISDSSNNNTTNNNVVMICFKLSEPSLNSADLRSFTHDLHVKFFEYNLTTRLRYFYLSHRCSQDEIEVTKASLYNTLSEFVPKMIARYNPEVSYEHKIGFVYHYGDDVEEFIRKITKIADE